MLATNNQYSKVKTKEQLKEELQEYQTILNKSILGYLCQLIELDVSVVGKDISDKERKIISDLQIYRDVAIYNIYYRAVNLLQDSKIQPNIFEYVKEKEIYLSAEVEDYNIDLFRYDFEDEMDEHVVVPEGYIDRQIGKIRLYQTIEDEEVRKQEIEVLSKNLEKLKNRTNPFFGLSDLQATRWELDNIEKIELYESRIKKLSSKVLTETDEKAIEYTNYVHDLFMKDYGLTKEDFTEYVPKRKLTEMQKVYVNNAPNLQIVREVNYL